MHAIIRLENGRYYTSAVFGRFYDESSSENTDLLVVFNQAKDSLIALPELQFTEDGFISRKVIIYDTHDNSWRYSNIRGTTRHYGCVAYLNREKCFDLVRMAQKGIKNTGIPEQCYKDDQATPLKKWTQVRTDYDIKNLLSISNNFQDAYVAECQRDKKNGNIRVLFKACWGTDVELVFQKEASCHLHNPEEYEPWWYDCKLMRYRNKYYLFDSSNADAKDIDTWDSDYFCAKELYFHILPR